MKVEILYFGNGYMLCDYMDGWRLAEFSSRLDAVAYAQNRGWKIIHQM